MEILIRDYEPGDDNQIVEIYREFFGTSDNGMTDEAIVDKFIGRGGLLLVAQVKDSNEVAGICGFSNHWLYRIIGSTSNRGIFVRKKFQRGKGGVNVGTLLSKARDERCLGLGYRKSFGYAVADSLGFHKRFNKRFYSEHNYVNEKGTLLHYCEAELRPSILNGARVEPYIYTLVRFYIKMLKQAGKK